MEVKQLFSQLNLHSEVVAIAIIAFALVLILWLNRKRLKTRFAQWRIRRSLDQIGQAQIRNLVCADGLDGFYTIDRLALISDAILLTTGSSIPKSCEPIRASPESFKRIRRYAGCKLTP